MKRFEGKVAIVTGAGSGIGRATALRLAGEGARVVVVDWNEQTGAETLDLLTQVGGDGMFLHRDVSKVADTESIVADTVARFGQLNVLVNNAGIIIEKNAVDTTEADWDQLIGVNLKGAFFCAKNAILQFRRQGTGGSIVNVASINTYYAEGGIAVYCITKGGLGQLTRALAMDHSAEGIRVNAVCPGWIETPLNKNFLAIGPHIREQVGRMHAIGRIGQPEEVATAVSYLASDEASFITGALLAVDGGITAGLAPTLGVVL